MDILLEVGKKYFLFFVFSSRELMSNDDVNSFTFCDGDGK